MASLEFTKSEFPIWNFRTGPNEITLLQVPCKVPATCRRAAMSFQTSAQTSCCSIANLTLASLVNNGDGAKTMWKTVSGGAVRNESHNPAAPWTTWAGALKNAGCSAGAEGQDPRSAAGGWPNWLNMSVGYPFPIHSWHPTSHLLSSRNPRVIGSSRIPTPLAPSYVAPTHHHSLNHFAHTPSSSPSHPHGSLSFSVTQSTTDLTTSPHRFIALPLP